MRAIVKIDLEHEADAYAWCLENSIHLHKILGHTGISLGGTKTKTITAFQFNNEEDALAFKLRWL